MVLLALGEFRFSINTAAYSELRRETAWRWPAQQRLGRPPARQFVGRGDDIITLPGTIYPAEFRAGTGQPAAMRAAADKGEPLPLTAGDGTVLGQWVILRVVETQSVFWPDGTPRRQDFELELAAYGEDLAETAT